MPIVGIVTFAVMSAAIVPRDALEHDRERPGLFGGRGVGQQLLRVALHAVAAELVDALRPQPAVGHHRNAGRDERRDRLGLVGAPFELHRLAARFLEDPAGVFDRLVACPGGSWGTACRRPPARAATARPTISAW